MKRPLILLVEDHPLNRMLVTDLLEAHGIEVAEAVDAEQGRAWLAGCAARRLPDLVLTDIQMPGGGGQQVLRAVREDARLCALPVIAVTAQAMAGDAERLLAAGFDGYIGKPIDTRTFVDVVRGFMRSGAS